jgi:hypothetical protein
VLLEHSLPLESIALPVIPLPMDPCPDNATECLLRAVLTALQEAQEYVIRSTLQCLDLELKQTVSIAGIRRLLA